MKNAIFLFFLTCTIFSCIEKYDFRFPKQDPFLVVEGIVTDGYGPNYVRLTWSKSTFAPLLSSDSLLPFHYYSDAEPVLDAKVIISDNHGVIDTLTPANDSAYRYYYKDEFYKIKDSVMDFNPKAHYFGYYQTNTLVGVSGNTYYLKIICKGKEYKSSCYMPPVPKIDSVTYEFTQGAIGKSDFYVPKIWFKDNPATVDYYLFITTGGSAWGRSVISDANIKSNVTGLNVFHGESSDWWLNGYPWPGQLFRIEMNSITKEIYNYYQSLIMQFRDDGGIYTPSPASPPTNITNGAQGYFRASSVRVVEDIMPSP